MQFDTEFLKTLKKLQNPDKVAEIKFKLFLMALDLKLKGKHIYQRAKKEFKTWVN